MTAPDSAAPPSPPIKRRYLVLLGFIVFAVFAGLLEFGARVYLKKTQGYDGEHLYQFAFDPYKNILPTPNYVDTRGVRHNSMGFRRSSEVSREKPPGTYRIFLMGASAGYGLGGLWTHIENRYPVLKNSETIDAFLEQDLNARYPGRHFEVINAAITSTWTHHNLIYLNQTILRYQPDMVLFLDGFNDFFFYNPDHDQFASYTYNLPSRAILGEPTLWSLAYANGWWLFRKSAFIHLVARGASNLKLLISKKPTRDPIDVNRALANHRKVFPVNALAMQERSGVILHHYGIVPVFMLQPMLILERGRAHPTEIEQRLFEFNVDSYLPNYEAFATGAASFIREQETAMAARVGGTFIDLTGIFQNVTEQVFTDYAHLTPQGNQVLAKYVADQIAPLIRLVPDSTRPSGNP